MLEPVAVWHTVTTTRAHGQTERDLNQVRGYVIPYLVPGSARGWTARREANARRGARRTRARDSSTHAARREQPEHMRMSAGHGRIEKQDECDHDSHGLSPPRRWASLPEGGCPLQVSTQVSTESGFVVGDVARSRGSWWVTWHGVGVRGGDVAVTRHHWHATWHLRST